MNTMARIYRAEAIGIVFITINTGSRYDRNVLTFNLIR